MVKVHHDEGVAIHIGPKPCGGIREDVDEASVGEHAGQPLSRDRNLSRMPTPLVLRKATWRGAIRRVPTQSGVVGEPGMHGRSLLGNREISRSAMPQVGSKVRSG